MPPDRPLDPGADADASPWDAGHGELLTDGVTVGETKNAFHLVEGNVLLNLHYVLVEARAHPAKTNGIKPQAQRVASCQGRSSGW